MKVAWRCLESKTDDSLSFSVLAFLQIKMASGGLQSSDTYVHYYYGDGVAQGFVVEFGGGLVHTIRYVNKLTT